MDKNLDVTRQESAENRQKAVNMALLSIEKQFGKGSIMKLGDGRKLAGMNMGAISTGSLSLDLAMGIGGIPRGRITEIFGPESSGKTTIALYTVAQAQKEGGVAAFIDAEHALDVVYAKKLGVNIEDLLISQPDTGEQALEICEILVRSGGIDVVVIDSVAALVPRAELEGEMGDSHMGLQARLMSQALRKLTGCISKSKTAVIFINQLRMKIGVMFGNPETTTGGNALKFYASARLDIRRVSALKNGDEVIGSRTRVKVVKNKMAPPFRQVEFDILFGEGISKEGDIIDLAQQYNVIEKSGSWFAFEGEKLGQGRDNTRLFLKEHQELVDKIRKKIEAKVGSDGVVIAPVVAPAPPPSPEDESEDDDAKNTPETKQLVIQQFEQILKRATEKRSSDLHLKAGLPPIVRVNGHLYYLGDDASDTVSRLTNQQLNQFAYALMTLRQTERYENGEEVDLGYELTGVGRFRINLCQQRSNPRLVCRYIPDMIRGIDELCLPPVVEELTQAHRGMILVTGATGSGKSTTLAAMIDHIARMRSCHIVTIEDPIEFIFKDRKSIVTQREVGLDTRNFAQALKYSLRQDPDVILVGEMRDEETVMMALSAAETGHLVLSTLHTVDAPETINRILGAVSSGAQAQVRAQLSNIIVGVVSQRLLRRKDGKGRIPAVEILLSNVRVKEMIADPKRTADIARVIEESFSDGMQTFDQSLMQLYQQGLITKEEALNNCTNVRDFTMRLQGVIGGEWREKSAERTTTRHDQVRDALDAETSNQSIEIEGVNRIDESSQPSKKTATGTSRRK